MAIKKEDAALRANARKEKKPQKNYEGGIDPQDEQLNAVPEGNGDQQGHSKPGGGNRLHTDTGSNRNHLRK